MNHTYLIPEIFISSHRFYYVLLGHDGFYITANQYFFEKFSMREDDLEQKPALEYVYQEDRDVCEEVIEWCFKNPGKPYSLDVRKLQTDDKYRIGRWELSAIPNSSSSDLCIQCIGYDITEEVALKEAVISNKQEIVSKQKIFERLLSNSIDVILLTDKTSTITYCSPNVKKVLGYEPQELIGKTGFSFVHPDDQETAIKIFEEEYRNPDRNNSVDLRFRKKDGSWLWAEAKGKNLFNDSYVQAMLLNLNDISLRKKTEQALEENELRYKTFFHQLPLPLFVMHKENKRIIDVNNSAVEKYGYSKEELLQLTFCDLFQEKMTCCEMECAYNKEEPVHLKAKNGQVSLATIEKQAMDYEDGHSCLILITDITEANRIEQESKLAYDVSEILIQPNPLQHNLTAAIKRIRSFTGWDLAEMWAPSYDEVEISKKVTAYDNSVTNKHIEKFLADTDELTFTISDYKNVPSYQTLKPYWIEDLEEGIPYQRKQLAIDCGFKSTLSVPIISNGEMVSFLIFLSFQKKTCNQSDANLLSMLGNLLGAEIEKRKNDLVLEKFFSISSDILSISGLDGIYKRVNHSFEKFIGYTQEEAMHIHPLSYVHDDEKATVLIKLKELSSGKTVPYFETRVVTKEGAVKWIAWTATPIAEEGMVIASYRDITSQKLAAEEIKISNERYELIKKAANEAIWDFDMINQTIIRSNGYKTLFGYDTDKEHSDLNFWESKLHPQDRERVMDALHQFIANAKELNWQCEYRFQRIDGTYAYVSDKGHLIFDKERNPIRMVGSMQDITEQKEFAEKLKISNERYELVTKATNEAIWDLDLTNHEIIWSEGYKILFGHDFNDTENGLDFWASNIHPQEQEKVISGFNDFLQQHNTPFWSSEYRFMRKDGSYANVLDKGYLIFDKENEPLRMVGSMQDITERKELEQELLIRERNRQNQIAQAVVFAQEKERAEIGKELHDNIGQLLTTTKLYLEMLRHKQQDPLELIERGTKHINTVISEIRNLSRSLVPTSITDLGLIASVNDLIESIEALGNMEIDFFSVHDIENSMNESLKLTLYRILQEQMNNIVRHAEAGKVSIELFEEDNFINLIITDDGKGFNTETAKRGQGFKNIYSRAELQNGLAEIISYPGKGCKLKVQILVNN